MKGATELGRKGDSSSKLSVFDREYCHYSNKKDGKERNVSRGKKEKEH